MNAPNPPLSDLDNLKQLIERYASYTHSAGGLSSVLGCLLLLAMFSIGLLVELDTSARAVLALTPLVWLLAKEALRRFYYQRSGAVGEKLSEDQRRSHLWLTLFTAFISAMIVGSGLWKFGLVGMLDLPWPKLSYVGICLLMPAIVWRWLLSSSDYVIGVLLLCQAAVIVAGSHYKADWLGVYIVFVSLLYFFKGLKEHREYLRLREDLKQSRQALQSKFA